MSDYEVVLKKVEPIKAACKREILPNYYAMGQLFQNFNASLRTQARLQESVSSYSIGIWHENDYKESDLNAEIAIPIDDNSFNDRNFAASIEGMQVYELPSVETMACVVHRGSYNTINNAYIALKEWIFTNGYQIIGPARDVYIIGGPDSYDESFVTEVQFPVQKADVSYARE